MELVTVWAWAWAWAWARGWARQGEGRRVVVVEGVEE